MKIFELSSSGACARNDTSNARLPEVKVKLSQYGLFSICSNSQQMKDNSFSHCRTKCCEYQHLQPISIFSYQHYSIPSPAMGGCGKQRRETTKGGTGTWSKKRLLGWSGGGRHQRQDKVETFAVYKLNIS